MIDRSDVLSAHPLADSAPIGTGAGQAARQGNSVALSADGNAAILGGYLDNGGRGAAWVFTRSGGV
jgi:hypothetical protein